MQASARVGLWAVVMLVGLAVDAASGSANFLAQTVVVPLWALMMAVLLPGEAIAELARASVRRATPGSDETDKS